jgi:hypothetical protein
VGGQELLWDLWRGGISDGERAQCMEAIAALTPWIDMQHVRPAYATVMELMADVLLTAQDALARELHRDDPLLPTIPQ